MIGLPLLFGNVPRPSNAAPRPRQDPASEYLLAFHISAEPSLYGYRGWSRMVLPGEEPVEYPAERILEGPGRLHEKSY